MYCLRCGRETKDEQVFCAGCLDTMRAYPVKPGTAVHLPEQRDRTRQTPVPRRQPTAEEQLAQLRSTTRILISAVVLLSMILGVTAWLLVSSLNDSGSPMPGNLGRNYTAVETGGD